MRGIRSSAAAGFSRRGGSGGARGKLALTEGPDDRQECLSSGTLEDRHSCLSPSSRLATSGFTLLEVLLSLMLTGMVLVSTTFFIFSMGELWGRGVEDRLFDRHARGVTRFLQSTISQSLVSQDPAEPGRISLSQPPGIGRFDDSLITFELMEGPPFLVWPDAPLPAVVCYLKLEPGEGLFLLWHSRLEIDFEEQAPRTTLLSPFVTELIYDYYDPETKMWTTVPEFENDNQGEPKLPTRIRLVFEYDDMSKETILTLPQQSASVALF